MRRWRRGVIFGKFRPPHKGHGYLIRYALEQVDALTVIVCDDASDSIRPTYGLPGCARSSRPSTCASTGRPATTTTIRSSGRRSREPGSVRHRTSCSPRRDTATDSPASLVRARLRRPRAHDGPDLGLADPGPAAGPSRLPGAVRPRLLRAAGGARRRRVDRQDDAGAPACRALPDGLGARVRRGLHRGDARSGRYRLGQSGLRAHCEGAGRDGGHARPPCQSAAAL